MIPTHCSGCGAEFTKDNPARGGALRKAWCGPCLGWGKCRYCNSDVSPLQGICLKCGHIDPI